MGRASSNRDVNLYADRMIEDTLIAKINAAVGLEPKIDAIQLLESTGVLDDAIAGAAEVVKVVEMEVATGLAGSAVTWDPTGGTGGLVGLLTLPKGDKGNNVTISSIVNHGDSSITISFSDGTTHTTGILKGADGLNGAKGSPGVDAREIVDIEPNDYAYKMGTLVKYIVRYDDNSTPTEFYVRQGHGITSVEEYDVNTSPGYVNTYRIHLSTGGWSDIHVRNGTLGDLTALDFTNMVHPNNINVEAEYKIGNPTDIDTLRKILDHNHSAGIVNGGDILVDDIAVDGTITIDVSSALLRATGATSHDALYSIEVPSSKVALTDNTTNIVYAEFNSGVPRYGVTTSATYVNMLDVVPLYIVVREGTSGNFLDVREQNVDSNAKSQLKQYYTEGFVRKNGGAVVGDAGTLHINCTVGAFYFQLNEYALPALDTTGTDTFEYYYRNGTGGWIETDASTINPEKIDTGTGTLVQVANNKFKNDWIYAVLGTTPHYAIVYGTGEYNALTGAEAEGAPTTLPPSVAGTGVLLGRAISQQGTTELIDVETAFRTTFSSTLAANHNNMSGLQGGLVNEYYHLSAANHTELLAVAADNYKATEIDALRGVANGLATLDSTGLVPSAQLPSYVDDVLEYAAFVNLPVTGETGKIYVTVDDNHQYRWSGTAYIDITTDIVAVADRRKLYAKETLARDVVVGDVTTGKATIILTVAENLYGRVVISDTGTLTSVAGELLISSDVRDLIVVNNDNVDCKVWRDNGSGVGVGGFVTVPYGDTIHLYCDGTNVILNEQRLLLAEIEVTGSETDFITFTGLDINKHKSYRLEIDVVGGSAGTNNYMYVGDTALDTTVSNYDHQIQIANGTAVSASSGVGLLLGAVSTSLNAIFSIDVRLVNGKANFSCIAKRLINFNTRSTGEYSVSLANIKTIGFGATGTNLFGVGTKARIYRGDL